jgi:hypothetical protein
VLAAPQRTRVATLARPVTIDVICPAARSNATSLSLERRRIHAPPFGLSPDDPAGAPYSRRHAGALCRLPQSAMRCIESDEAPTPTHSRGCHKLAASAWMDVARVQRSARLSFRTRGVPRAAAQGRPPWRIRSPGTLLRRKVRRTGSGMSRPIEGQDAPFDRTAGKLALKVTGRASLGRRPCAGAMAIPAIHHRHRA